MKKGSILALIALFLLAVCAPIGAKAANYQWVSAGNGDKRCYMDGKLVKNKWVGDRHLNAKGYMDRNKWLTRKINGVKKTVFVRNDGRMVENFKAGWQKIGKKYYYYTSAGVLVRDKWITIALVGKYYVNKNGVRVTGLRKFSDGYRYFDADGKSQVGWVKLTVEENGQSVTKQYYFKSGTRLALQNGFYRFSNGKVYSFDEKGVLQTGWQLGNSGKYYYFDKEMKTGWLTLDGSTYYLDTSGARVSGIYGISGKLYYFDENGVMLTDTTVEYDGRMYIVEANGECSLVPDTSAPTADMLFFLQFESGSEAYRQTGGDHGNACGAYQFDNRYSLLPFVKYAYGQNAVLCAEFKNFAGLTDGTKLKSNKKFFKAWKTIYKRNPSLFAELQDKFAKVNYYDPVEAKLSRAGIDLGSRPDVVKGAVYSYSIQHGQETAYEAALACKITSATTDKQFLKKLYRYRIKNFPAYETRYSAEYLLAVSKLP